MSLLEVLAAIGVLSIGLLGLAALLPIGRYTLGEATKADRAGQCGRAALRAVMVRHMLDFHNWYDPAQNKFVGDPTYNGGNPWYDQFGNPTANLPASFILDPEGVAYYGANPPPSPAPTYPTFGNGGTKIPRITLANPVTGLVITGTASYTNPVTGMLTSGSNSIAMAEAIFQAPDDLVLPMPEDMSPPQPLGRPLNVNTTGTPLPLDHSGAYSWFLTVSPQANNPARFPFRWWSVSSGTSCRSGKGACRCNFPAPTPLQRLRRRSLPRLPPSMTWRPLTAPM